VFVYKRGEGERDAYEHMYTPPPMIPRRTRDDAYEHMYTHPMTGNCLYCFVTLKAGQEGSDTLTKELKTLVSPLLVCVYV
jgi:hypothetical protein